LIIKTKGRIKLIVGLCSVTGMIRVGRFQRMTVVGSRCRPSRFETEPAAAQRLRAEFALKKTLNP